MSDIEWTKTGAPWGGKSYKAISFGGFRMSVYDQQGQATLFSKERPTWYVWLPGGTKEVARGTATSVDHAKRICEAVAATWNVQLAEEVGK